MGYQIFSVVEFRGELQKQKEENIKLAHDNAKLQQMIRNQMGALDKQKGRIEEGLNMCFSYINYFSGQDVCTAFGAFVPMLDALYYSLDSDEDGIDDIFSTLRLFVSKIQTQSFAIPGGYGDVHGKYIIKRYEKRLHCIGPSCNTEQYLFRYGLLCRDPEYGIVGSEMHWHQGQWTGW